MSVKSTPVSLVKSTTVDTPVLWIRTIMHFVATQELGWAHQQVSTTVDVYTKGKGAQLEVITFNWGSSQLTGYSHSKGGKAVSAPVEGKVNAKLQRAQTSLGKPMDLTAKWSITPKAKADFHALGLKTFKVITPS